MSVHSRLIAALGISGHHFPHAGPKDALRDAAVFGAPTELDEVFAKVGAVKADDA